MKQGDFSSLAKHYINRPAYSQVWLDTMLKIVTPSKKELEIIEVGAGTGKLTKMFAEKGLKVHAVEPSAEMLEEGKRYVNSPSLKWSLGSGEANGQQSNSFDWAVMASSFHWTDPSKSLPEFHRVLREHSYLTVLWNPRNIESSEFHLSIENKINEMVPNLKRVSSGKQNVKDWTKILVEGGYFKDPIFLETDHTEFMSPERYMGAWKSVNDIQAQAGDVKWKQILDMIQEKISGMDIIEVPYKIRSWTVTRN